MCGFRLSQTPLLLLSILQKSPLSRVTSKSDCCPGHWAHLAGEPSCSPEGGGFHSRQSSTQAAGSGPMRGAADGCVSLSLSLSLPHPPPLPFSKINNNQKHVSASACPVFQFGEPYVNPCYPQCLARPDPIPSPGGPAHPARPPGQHRPGTSPPAGCCPFCRTIS